MLKAISAARGVYRAACNALVAGYCFVIIVCLCCSQWELAALVMAGISNDTRNHQRYCSCVIDLLKTISKKGILSKIRSNSIAMQFNKSSSRIYTCPIQRPTGHYTLLIRCIASSCPTQSPESICSETFSPLQADQSRQVCATVEGSLIF